MKAPSEEAVALYSMLEKGFDDLVYPPLELFSLAVLPVALQGPLAHS